MSSTSATGSRVNCNILHQKSVIYHTTTSPGGIPGQKENSMNKQRRNKIAEAIDLIEQAREILEAVQKEEQEALDNMPESIQNSERGETMAEYISTIEDFIAEHLDTDSLQEIVDA